MLTKRAKHTAVLCFRLDKTWKERSNRKGIDVAGMDAAKQRFRDRGNGRRPKAAPKKRGNRLVLESAMASNQWFKRETRARERRQQVVVEDSAPCRRNAEDGWRGQRMQSTPLEDEGRAWDVGRDNRLRNSSASHSAIAAG